ncbi:MAG: DUF1254 domain-containing protein [Deltaproteobacteria bacterium]|nr:DUF1254 domain-containing protein [Deltaproteobacteria bacterium]
MRAIVIMLLCATALFVTGCESKSIARQPLTFDEVESERAYHRAKEAVYWSQGVMGVALSLDAIQKLGGDYNDIVYLSQPANWKWQILTPNSVSLYIESVIKTASNEPVVIEIPPVTAKTDIFGTIMDSFQTPLVDVGSSGIDAGKGGKYLILPAFFDGTVPDGYIPVHTERNISFFNFRAIPTSFGTEDLAAANAFIQNISVYPLNAPEQKGKHIDVYDKTYQNIDPRDSTYFDFLTDILNEETIVERDLMMMSMMKSFGYEHGESFRPSTEDREMLSRAAVSAIDDLVVMTRDIAGPWWEGHPGWLAPTKAIGPTTEFRYVTKTEYAIDSRAETYSMYCCAPVTLGAATAYILASRDMDGAPLEAQSSYRLHVPANVPIDQFWSLTAYDAQTAVFFEDVATTDISSLDTGVQYNEDGSVYLYVGPNPPEGKESNWIETNSKNNSMFLFRFYGPKTGVRDGSWIMEGFTKQE